MVEAGQQRAIGRQRPQQGPSIDSLLGCQWPAPIFPLLLDQAMPLAVCHSAGPLLAVVVGAARGAGARARAVQLEEQAGSGRVDVGGAVHCAPALGPREPRPLEVQHLPGAGCMHQRGVRDGAPTHWVPEGQAAQADPIHVAVLHPKGACSGRVGGRAGGWVGGLVGG